ncbi:hypothetical protein JYU34_008104 [Plutella xylostella]|uniref:Uncharacterized protein n=1 Tax=Plutella xylostella TaxID=51655 RepID=A0ABQ7QNQ6_PLUXY|nr:hypothetical protein JYU34_008104 [Plutella xylostella]
MSINPTANRGREVSNALELYDKLAQEEGFEATINTSSGWIWEDKFLITDFKLLKPSNEPSLTTALTNLQCFYLMYFGEVATPANPGGLFCQLLATSPHFSSPKDQLIEFDKKGTIEICQYTPFPDVDTVLKRFLDDEAPPAQDLDKEITAPVPENEGHLVGSPADPEFAGDEKEATTRLTAAGLEETGMFRMAVIVAFKALQNVKETDCWSAHKSQYSHLLSRYKKAKDSKATFKLFPYCRLIHQTYLADLGYRGNEDLCYLMACLIDEKSPPPPTTGGARAAEWTKSLNSKTKSEIQKVGCKMFEGESSFRLTSFNSNKTDYKVDSHAGEKWTPPDDSPPTGESPKDADDDYFECGAPTHLS